MRGDAAIFTGEVVHKRVRPVEHKLRYRVFSLMLDVDRLDTTVNRLKLVSKNRFNVFSIFERDHGHRDGSTLADFAWQQVRHAGLEQKVKRITVLLYPRLFGYGFNPLTVYFCLNSDGEPELMIYEVRNTFGEDLTYVLPAGENHDEVFSHAIDKTFYVSPFNTVEGHYSFHVTRPEDNLTVGVALKTAAGPLLRTHFRGTSRTLSDWTLVKMLFAYPLMTAKVMAAIHWEALKLWRKGLKLKTRPPAPRMRVLYGGGLKQSAS